jgi:hypothetical protein
MDIAAWLRTMGLEQYEAAFRGNEIDAGVLPSLTAKDLKETRTPHWSGIADDCATQ